MAQVSLVRVISWSSHDERISSTLSPPFLSTSSSSHSSSTSCTPSCTSSTTLRAVATLRTSPERKWTPLATPTYLLTGYEPKSYDLKETCVESFSESLTHPQLSQQGFLEDVDYDDTALEDMLREAHRVHVYHSQREGLSVGQSSSVSERTADQVVRS